MQKILDRKKLASARYLSGIRQANRLLSSTPPPRLDNNLIGIGIGPKIVEGFETPTLAIRFYLIRKLPKGRLTSSVKVPEHFLEIPTDVIATGPLLPACNRIPGPIHGSFRPVQPGCRIRLLGEGSGTLGAIVQRDGVRMLLTNNHVIAKDNIDSLGRDVAQPDKDTIAKVTEFVPLRTANHARVDAAIAELAAADSPVLLSNVGPLASTVPVAASTGMIVEKVGQTSGFACGTIFDISFDYTCPYGFGTVKLYDQLLIRSNDNRPFALSGDSGSLVVGHVSRRATGLLFAVDTDKTGLYAVANPIDQVLTQLRVTLAQ